MRLLQYLLVFSLYIEEGYQLSNFKNIKNDFMQYIRSVLTVAIIFVFLLLQACIFTSCSAINGVSPQLKSNCIHQLIKHFMNAIRCKSTQMVHPMATRAHVRCLSCGAKAHDIKM